MHNTSPWPRHQVALCYSADRVREATIVNSTGLRDLYAQPRRPDSAGRYAAQAEHGWSADVHVANARRRQPAPPGGPTGPSKSPMR